MRVFWAVAGLCLACGRGGSDRSPSDAGTEAASEVVADAEANPCTMAPSLARVGIVDPGPGVGAHASAAVAPDGNPCVAYAVGAAGASFRGVRVSCLGPQGWSSKDLPGEVEVDPSWIGRAIALLVQPDGRLVLFFHPAGGDGLLGVREEDEGDWTVTTVDPKEGVGLDVSAAMGTDGVFHVAYLDLGDGDLRHAWGVPDHFEVEVVDAEGITGNDPSLALDRQGRVHVAYFGCGELTPAGCTGELRYAVRGPKGFAREVVEAGDDTGWYSSLALDDQDAPHVAWHVHGSGRLRHATRGDGTWRIEEVDGGPGAGGFASLVLLDGQPVIAYGRQGSDGLLVAFRSPDGFWSRVLWPGSGQGSFASLARLPGCGVFGAWRDPEGLMGAFF